MAAEMQSLAITTKYTLEDWRALQKACGARLQQAESPNARLIRIAAFVVVGIGIAWAMNSLEVRLQAASIIVGVMIVAVPIWLSWRASMRRLVPEDDGSFFAEQHLEIGPEGIRTARKGLTAFTSWSTVRDITIAAEHVFIWLDRFQAYLIPLRQLPDGVTAASLREQLESWRASFTEPDAVVASLGSSAVHHVPLNEAAANAVSSDAKRWTSSLLQLLSLRRASLPSQATPGVIFALAGLSLVTWLGIDWLSNQPDPSFYTFGIPYIGWYALIMLAVAAALARRSSPPADFSAALVLVLAVTPLAILANYAIERYVPQGMAILAWIAVFTYFSFYAAKGMQASTGSDQSAAVFWAIVLAMVLSLTTANLYVEPSVWAAAEEEEGTPSNETWEQAEPLMFSQPRRIEQAVAALAPPDAAAPDVFFVGFAGFAEQRVFAEEIALAARVIGERYGSQERSLFLVNDRRDLQRYPLASPTALKYALAAVASKMDVEQDILFLSLSSHGSKDASLSVSNGMLMLNSLTAADLAAALREARIKWRVIVISACYAGSFITALRDPNTIVLTAAAPDRTSFGCSDERDLTYFGEAFYRDALPKAASLREAFNVAKAAIAQREESEEVEPSKPQAYFGAQLERRLQQMERLVERPSA